MYNYGHLPQGICHAVVCGMLGFEATWLRRAGTLQQLLGVNLSQGGIKASVRSHMVTHRHPGTDARIRWHIPLRQERMNGRHKSFIFLSDPGMRLLAPCTMQRLIPQPTSSLGNIRNCIVCNYKYFLCFPHTVRRFLLTLPLGKACLFIVISFVGNHLLFILFYTLFFSLCLQDFEYCGLVSFLPFFPISLLHISTTNIPLDFFTLELNAALRFSYSGLYQMNGHLCFEI